MNSNFFNEEKVLSLIIPTYNRPKLLKILLEYYQTMEFQYAIFVADSSLETICDMNRKSIEQVANKLVIHYKRFDDNINPYLKISQALESCNTEFAVICADDDFIVPNSLDDCVEFLQANTSYHTAKGHTIGIIPRDPNLFGTKNHYTEAGFDLSTSLKRQDSIEDDSPFDRLQKLFFSHAELLYSVHYRKQLIPVFHKASTLIQSKIPENLVNSLAIIHGKSKVLDNLYMVKRSFPNVSREWSSNYLSWLETLSLDYFSQEYAIYRDFLVNELLHHEDSTEGIKKEVDNLFWAYIVHYHTVKGLDPKYMKIDASRMFSGGVRMLYSRTNQSSNYVARYFQKLKHLIELLPHIFYTVFFRWQILELTRSLKHSRTLTFVHLRQKYGLDFAIESLLSNRSRFHKDFYPIYRSVLKSITTRGGGL